MNNDLRSTIITILIIIAFIFIFFISGFVICTLVIFDVVKTPLIIKILSYITNILISMFFGMFIFYNTEGGNEKWFHILKLNFLAIPI
jgi:hypothetical protein